MPLHQDHPKDMVVKKNYIQLLILKDRLDEARKLNDEVVKAKPDDQDAQIYKGEIEIRSGKANDAVNTLQAVLKNDPDNAVAHYQQGLAFDQLGNTNRAEAEWREAVRLRPDIVEAHRALAGVAIHRSDPSGLAQEADQIIALQPARLLTDTCCGPWPKSIASSIRRRMNIFTGRWKKEPNNPAAYVQLGNLRMAQNQLAEAQKAYQQALDQDPNSTDALGGVLNVDLVQKQPDRALATAKTQLARYPKNAGFHIMLGQMLMEQKKDLAGAEQEFKQASELDKKNSEAWLSSAWCRTRRSTDQALQTYLRWLEGQSQRSYFLPAGGWHLREQKDWDHAKQQYQKVLEIQPDNPLASNNMAYVMLQQGGNVDVALAMAQTARRQLPDNPNSADTLGWAFYHKHVYTSAITLFKEAIKKEPDNALFNYHLGLAYAKSLHR
jgi:tetratricopeptide (TPR) repeat protein